MKHPLTLASITKALAKFASTDNSRPVLNGVHFSSENGECVATDGRVLASIKFPCDATRTECTRNFVCKEREYKHGKVVKTTETRYSKGQALEKYPNYRCVIPLSPRHESQHIVSGVLTKLKSVTGTKPQGSKFNVVELDGSILSLDYITQAVRLFKSMGCETFTHMFTTGDDPSVLLAGDATVVIMPLRNSPDTFNTFTKV